MTSISIISAVVARGLLLLQEDYRFPEEWKYGAEKLFLCLISISQQLKDADPGIKQRRKIVESERTIVQLSYEIDDAIAEACKIVFSPRPRIQLLRRSSMPDLDRLRSTLGTFDRGLQEELHDDKNKRRKMTNTRSFQSETSHEANIPAIPTGQENQVTAALLETDLPVVCIWGESGMGKTTLVKKVFYDGRVRRHFKRFAWVPLTRDIQTKHVLRAILKKLLIDSPRKVDTIREMGETELTEEVFTVLNEKRCLVVLEDLWDVQDWQSIRVAFPSNSNSGSKILITSTSEEVALEATAKRGPSFKMEPQTEAECFMMLRKKAGFKDDGEFRRAGEIICRLSGGSPLIALILGKSFKDMDVDARKKFLPELDSYLSISQISVGATQVLGLSYERLPHELKPCLLYMGKFPLGKNIEAEKLYLLLAAEGLIVPEDSGNKGTMSMESLRSILEKLSRKRLVQAEDTASTVRMYESCRLHDHIRNFCISKGQEEDFFEVVDFQSKRKLRPSTRRLAIYLSKYRNGHAIRFSSPDMVKKIRSLLIFDDLESQRSSTWPGEINDLKEFRKLRVLDFDGIDFRVRPVPRGIDKLFHLRYVSLRGCYLGYFPSTFGNSPCLETLDLRVNPDCKMTIPNILFNMKRLKHLYFPMLYQSTDRNIKLRLHDLERLEILVNFHTEVCSVEDLFQFNNLQILTIISEGNHKNLGAVIEYLDEKATNLQQTSLGIKNFIGNGTNTFKKLLQCKNLHSLHVEGSTGPIPKRVQYSQSFTEMVFNGSELENDPMGVLGKLDNLQSLTLSYDAFLGNEMTFSAISKFPSLRTLKLLNLQYLDKLTFEQGALPKLSTLVIEKCGRLKNVLMPKELDDRLRFAQEKEGDDVYFVEPRPTIVDI